MKGNSLVDTLLYVKSARYTEKKGLQILLVFRCQRSRKRFAIFEAEYLLVFLPA